MMSACGRYRVHIASITSTPAARPASVISPASRADIATGFSTSMCLPAAIAANARS